MANVTLYNLNKRFPDPTTKQEVSAVKDLNLEIRDGEFLVLVGPSGCGKTTALRMIAGLEDVTSGEIRIGDRVVNDAPPGDRNIAMVFQNYALYPHMSVYDNMAFGLKLRLLSGPLKQFTHMAETRRIRGEIDRNIQEAAELLDIKHLLNRKPKALSGGQRQRVALGRAIVRHPQVFLMDEPLSNLDAQLRVQTRAELIKLHRKLGVTTVYVTHDQVEAMTMGQRIAVMKGGVLQQCDSPLKLYHDPANMFVAGFLGTPSMNFVSAIVTSVDDTGAVVDASSFQLRIPAARSGNLANYRGKEVVLGIRPEDIHDKALEAFNGDKSNQTTMHVDVVEAMGATSLVYLTAGEHTLIATVDADTSAREGMPIDLILDANAAHIFDVETEQTIV